MQNLSFFVPYIYGAGAIYFFVLGLGFLERDHPDIENPRGLICVFLFGALWPLIAIIAAGNELYKLVQSRK